MQSGIAPSELAGSATLEAAVRQAVREQWTASEEMLAQMTEILHQLLRATLGNLRVKHVQHLPRPYRVPRPWDKPVAKRKATPGEQARFFGARGGGRRRG